MIKNPFKRAGKDHVNVAPSKEEGKGSVMKTVLIKAIVFVFALAASYYLFDYLAGITEENVEALRAPWMALLTMLFAASLVTDIWQGKAAVSIKKAAVAISFVIFIAWLIADPPFRTDIDTSSLLIPWLVMGGLIAATIATVPWHHHAWVLMRAVTLMSMGWFLQTLAQAANDPDLSVIFIPAFLAVAVISLLGMFDQHSNAMLRSIGRIFRSNAVVVICTAGFSLLSWYELIYRPSMPEGSLKETSLTEWAAIGAMTALVLFMVLRYLKKKGMKDPMGEWGRLVQIISHEKGDMDNAIRSMEEFVNQGERKGLVVQTVMAMKANGVDEQRMEMAILELVNFTEREDRLYFSWAMGAREARKKEERLMVAVRTMKRAVESMNAGYLLHKIEKLETAGPNRGETK
jgi:hypothetical protein